MSDSTPRPYAVRNAVTAFDEFAPALPSYIEAPQPQQPIISNTTIGAIAISANVAVTIVIVVALLWGGARADLAIVRGIVYFSLSTPLFLLIVTGGLVAVVNAWQHERTERQRVEAYRELGELGIEWRLAVEETRQIELLGRRGSAAPVQPALPQNYVAPYAEGEQAQVEGVRFALMLYDAHGRPDPKRVHPDGRLKVKMIGSKRGSGSRDAGRWLLRAGIIKRVRGGYALATDRYPTRESLRHLL